MAVTKISNSSIVNRNPKYVSFLAGNDAYIPSDYESIATVTGTGSNTTITFDNIAGTYQYLQLRILARDAQATTGRNITIRANNDTGSNYARHELTGDGATASAAGQGSLTSIGAYTIPAASATANIYGAYIIDLHDYASTTKTKTFRILGGYDVNGTGGTIRLQSGLWNSTSAVTRLDIISNGAGFTTSSVVALYGIKG